MGTFLRSCLYLIALLLFAGGAFVIGGHVGAAQASAARKAAEAGTDAPKRGVVEILQVSVADAPGSPAWHLGVGFALAVLGMLIARPAVTVGAKKKAPVREERTRPLREVVQELSHADPNVRYQAARTLTRAAKPQTIPAFIRALQDEDQKVRGQACEALAEITGRTFDFMDVAPPSMRQQSVGRWVAWWKANKDAILAGADPKTADAPPAPEAEGAVPYDEAPLPDPDVLPPPDEPEDAPAPPQEAGPPSPEPAPRAPRAPRAPAAAPRPAEPSPPPVAPPGQRVTSALGSAAAAGKPKVAPVSTARRKRRSTAAIKRAALGLGSVREPEDKQPGRDVSIGELFRRKRERQAAEAAAAAGPGDAEGAPGEAAPAAPAGPAGPAGDDAAPAADTGAAPAEPQADSGPVELPSPDEELPPPE